MVLAGLPVVLLAACASPTFVDRGAGKTEGALDFNVVAFEVKDGYRASPPDCIAVLPLKVRKPADPQAKAEDAAKVRMSLYAHLATQSKRGVRPERIDRVLDEGKDDRKALGERLKCAAAIEGEVTEYGNTFLGIYSSVTVGADLRLIRLADGAVLWEGRHVAANRDGSVPLDPVGIAMGVFGAVDNIRDEQVLRVTDDLARRLVSTIPDDKVVALDDPVEGPPAKIGAAKGESLPEGERLLRSGDHAGALAAAEKAIVANPDDRDAWLLKGRVLMLDREYEKAEPTILKAVALDRGDVRSLNALGVLNTERGAPDRALAAYRMAIDADRGNGFAWYNTAVLHFNAGEPQEAADAFHGAALAYLKAGDFAKAERALGDLRELSAAGIPVGPKVESIQTALTDLSRRTP